MAKKSPLSGKGRIFFALLFGYKDDDNKRKPLTSLNYENRDKKTIHWIVFLSQLISAREARNT